MSDSFLHTVPRIPVLARGYISGLVLTFATVSTVMITVGEARDSSDRTDIVLATSFTADITVVGAGGLQAGSSEAADTWYEVHLIHDTFGNNPDDVLLIPAGTAFNQAGFNRSRRIGYVRNDASSDFIAFVEFESSNARYHYWRNAKANRFVLTAGSATVPTAVDASSLIPPDARLGYMSFEEIGTKAVRIRLTAGGVEITGFDKDHLTVALIPLSESQQFFYDHEGAGGALNVIVVGYREFL